MPKLLPRPNGQNYLIATMPAEDRALLRPHLHPVSLDLGTVLEEAGQPVEHVIFPAAGITSMIVSERRGTRRIEAGLFGFDGMSGTSALLGARSTPHELRVQVPGHGWQIGIDTFSGLIGQSAGLHQHLLRFVQALLIQTAQTALSNKSASVEERLARWLLMCHDRVEGDRLLLTHDFISVMLGVRRAGVTVATQILEGKGVIKAKRGDILILDRDGLEEEAGGSYGVPEAEYMSLFRDRP